MSEPGIRGRLGGCWRPVGYDVTAAEAARPIARWASSPTASSDSARWKTWTIPERALVNLRPDPSHREIAHITASLATVYLLMAMNS